MYTELPLWLSLVFIVCGFAALAWSSDVFVDGAAKVAKVLGISPLIIGMVIIGFGTSAPELCVSVMSGLSGHSNVSLGNAYGSCIFNIAVILGLAALIRPIVVKRSVVAVATPLLVGITLLSYVLLCNGNCSRWNASLLLVAFAIVMPVYCIFDQKSNPPVEAEKSESCAEKTGIVISCVKIVVGLVVLVASSHFLVWGSVDLARAFGVSELMIGLTIVAIGTSLPELASAIASARRGEHEFVIGNIVGSNIFNTLGVVGLATVISPLEKFSPYILSRDLPIMLGASLSLALFGFNFRKMKEDGRINRFEGLLWLLLFVAYSVALFIQESRGIAVG